MRETPKALQAWADYLAMGAERSLEKLLAVYEGAPEAHPTTRLETLKLWSRSFGWQARLAAVVEQERAAIVAKGIADKQNRVDALNDRWQRMQRIIEARARSPLMEGVDGGEQGLLVAEPMLVKVHGEIGEDGRFLPLGQAQLVHKFAVDTGLLAELRATEKQAAQELGQWVEKGELSGKNGEPLFKVYLGIDEARV